MKDLERRSWDELVDEARRRGVPEAESMDRESLIDALRGREGARSGAISIARSLLGRVASTVRAVLPTPERRSERPPPAPAREAPAASEALPAGAIARLADPALEGVSFDEGAALAVVWRVSDDAIARAQLLAPARAEIRLHTVRVAWSEADGAPRLTRSDHGVVRSEGTITLAPRAAGEKIVAAVGLAAPDGGFVAIAHATLG